MGLFTFRRHLGTIASDGTVTFQWSDDIEQMSIATDVRMDGSENWDATGYIGSGFMKTAIYVSI
jgi:hypothetical protein